GATLKAADVKLRCRWVRAPSPPPSPARGRGHGTRLFQGGGQELKPVVAHHPPGVALVESVGQQRLRQARQLGVCGDALDRLVHVFFRRRVRREVVQFHQVEAVNERGEIVPEAYVI